jgi:triphosphoribosyl-dephospho-CoA synthase
MEWEPVNKHPDAPNSPTLSLAQTATMACILEATAPKPGNVHRSADFEDVTFVDFLTSAVAIGPAISRAAEKGVGATVLAAIQATRGVTATNTNLGTVLLLAPLAAVAERVSLRDGVVGVLDRLTADDTRLVYEAIRLAQPGGLGRVADMDVTDQPPSDLREAMAAAADRDLVARQYVNGFQTVLDEVVPWLLEGVRAEWSLTDAILHTQLRILSQYPDSLIQRKCGLPMARQASERAQWALDCGRPGEPGFEQALSDLDFWLRSDHHRRNPGTTADLIAAGLFVGLREQLFEPGY